MPVDGPRGTLGRTPLHVERPRAGRVAAAIAPGNPPGWPLPGGVRRERDSRHAAPGRALVLRELARAGQGRPRRQRLAVGLPQQGLATRRAHLGLDDAIGARSRRAHLGLDDAIGARSRRARRGSGQSLPPELPTAGSVATRRRPEPHEVRAGYIGRGTQPIAVSSSVRWVTRATAMASESRARTPRTQGVLRRRRTTAGLVRDGPVRCGVSERQPRCDGAGDRRRGGEGWDRSRTSGAALGVTGRAGLGASGGSGRVGRLEKVNASGPNSLSSRTRGTVGGSSKGNLDADGAASADGGGSARGESGFASVANAGSLGSYGTPN